jgi:ribose transport system substrate-binding protein
MSRSVWRRVPAVALAAVVALVAAGCGSSSSDEPAAGAAAEGGAAKKEVRVALFVLATANTFSQAHVEGAKAKAAALGAKVTVFDGGFDASKQFKQIQDAVASGQYDAFMISPNSSPALVPAAKQAIDKGIKVAAIYGPLGSNLTSFDAQVPGITTTVMDPLDQVGSAVGEGIVKACEGKDPCNAVYIANVPTLPTVQIQAENTKRVASEHPNIKYTQISAADFTAEASRKAMQDYLAKTKDVDAVGATGDQGTAGAEIALKDAGVTGVGLVGSGASEVGVKAIKEGRWLASSTYYPRTGAELALEILVKAVRGEKAESAVNTLEGRPTLVTEENVDDFKPEWAG